MENINKSIIYGNIHQNRYGKFLPVCSSITDRSKYYTTQIMWDQFLTTFIKVCILRNTIESPMHIEWNKSQLSSSRKRKTLIFNTTRNVTVTKQLRAREKSYSICFRSLVNSIYNSDVKNVFIACLIQQFNPLLPFETTNYRAIV